MTDHHLDTAAGTNHSTETAVIRIDGDLQVRAAKHQCCSLTDSLGTADDRRRPAARNRSRSPVGIDRYQPDRDRGRERENDRTSRGDYYDASRAPNRETRDTRDARETRETRERDDRRRAPSPTVANIDRYVPGQEPAKPPVKANPRQNILARNSSRFQLLRRLVALRATGQGRKGTRKTWWETTIGSRQG
jgi:hypothetical protein